ncbi:hypothetical protein [Flavilitoribacter nigricans]|uniref:Outer membrane protein beta-barrel domain-containing protein n=1 Tax=Flavilitoribacter nigricans (strain ATCC 23147 / DSM 23189 / NBRC 102662 / NCIMB 1420 / SS-2) TaxID=1122177 RepID=A0A2D0N9U7_FLAN2|nr:hypothetical protein [Flavilitoribacter nigricans]PHN05255.1 hypothetical protein CRP01_17205 [Flavilitoribacter nigricans DSM 23189 = NBRC 102662]
MQRLSVFLLLSLGCSGLTAQSETWLQTSLNGFFSHQQKGDIDVEIDFAHTGHLISYAEPTAVYPGLGIQKIRKSSWFWGFHITGLTFSVRDEAVLDEFNNQLVIPIDGGRITHLGLFTRLEYGKIFLRDGNNKVFPVWSVSLDPHYRYRSKVPVTSAGFPRHFHQLGLTLRLIPGLSFQLAERLYLDLKLPVGLSNLSFESHQLDNPILSDEARKSSRFTSQIGLYDLQARIGLNFRL